MKMRKFKLIKEYPGCYYNTGDIVCKSNGSCYYKKGIGIAKNFVENYPEFWEEVVEKDYEILGFRIKDQIGDNNIFKLQPDGMYMRDLYISSPLSEFLDNDKYDIISIKRFSDGEVFTVGDTIAFCYGVTESNIQSFIITKAGSIVVNDFELEDIRKVKVPLFTTEDGVGIFKGDNCYPVTKDLKISYIYGNILRDGRLSSKKYFSTKEKAEEYILMNKPCLSINEVLSLNFLIKDFLIKEDLVKFTKKKLNEK